MQDIRIIFSAAIFGLLVGSCSTSLTSSPVTSKEQSHSNAPIHSDTEVIAIWEAGSSTGDFAPVSAIIGETMHYVDAQNDVAGKDSIIKLLKKYASESGGGLPNFKIRDITYGSGKAAGKVIVTAEFRPANAPTPIIFGEAITINNGLIVDYFSAYSLPQNP